MIELTLSSPITEEEWDAITDVDFDNTDKITFHTKNGKEAEFFKRNEPGEIIHCKDCMYYDEPHIEKDGVRYEYEDMPEDAFDVLGTGLVHLEYGINVGGRCCRDYHKGYSEDKRVFVPETNFCGRAERKDRT